MEPSKGPWSYKQVDLNSFGAKFQTTFVFCFLFLTTYRLERSLYVKLKDWMSNSIDPDETAHYEPSHLDLCCMQKPIIITCGSERVNLCCPYMTQRHKFAWHDPCYRYKDYCPFDITRKDVFCLAFYFKWKYFVLNDHILSETICLFCFCVLFSNMYPKIKFMAKNWSDLCNFYSKVIFWNFWLRK